MKYIGLNPATQRTESMSARGDEVFVRLELFSHYGDALLNNFSKTSLISLDSLCDLVATRIAILEGSEAEPDAERSASAKKKARVGA